MKKAENTLEFSNVSQISLPKLTKIIYMFYFTRHYDIIIKDFRKIM